MELCSNMFERDQILYKLVPWLRLGVWICRKLCVYLYNYVYACVRDPGPRPISWIGKAGAGMFSVDEELAGIG